MRMHCIAEYRVEYPKVCTGPIWHVTHYKAIWLSTMLMDHDDICVVIVACRLYQLRYHLQQSQDLETHAGWITAANHVQAAEAAMPAPCSCKMLVIGSCDDMAPEVGNMLALRMCFVGYINVLVQWAETQST